MSKHPSDNTKRNLLRRGLAGILCLALLLGLLPGTLTTADAASWADPYVNTLVDWGVMRGDVGGNMAPDRSITRAEFVTMMNRAYGYTKLGGHPFTDVRVRDWYNEDIDIAYNIGYFKGTGPTTASPNDTLTREQAAVLLARNMMLQPTVGETLGFSDSRSLSDWSRGLVGAAAANGIISGYNDGSFQPFRNITRGEVAAMLVRAIGTPIQTEGDHALGNVYGNVTVNTSGVKLRDGVIAGNLYLTGGIDLGDVLLENVTVLGEIIVSGGGESNSSQSSIVMRNVVADSMTVDSIGDQFVTIRAEGNTDIPVTTVRTNAYVDDSSLPGYGLSLITLDGDEGALYQLAGNIKEVLNRTPNSDLQVVQGAANKVTVDEYATGSSVLVDGDARVDDLNLDTAAAVTGTGDIGNLNVGAAGSTVEQLPDKITIRPGITTDIAGSNMNSTQAAESSSEPKLLAGYPAVRKIAPTNAELVFRTNKTGTIYWAVSAVADGSVSEADLLEPPVYGNKILASGSVRATAANTDYTAAVNGLTVGGSYYVTAMLVDGRDQHSPVKVTSFSTPDNTVPAFASGYPVMSKVTCDDAQVTVMTTKSCQLYYALLPKGAAAPTTNELKSAAVTGNLGYGTMSVTKNVTTPFKVNSVPLDEKTDYVLYLWLTDHDGAQSARTVTALPFTTPDETPPVVTDLQQTTCKNNSITLTYTIDEPANLVWAIVTEGNHNAKQFLNFDWKERTDPNDPDKFTLDFGDNTAEELAAKVRLMSGNGAILSSTTTNRSPFTISPLDPVLNGTSSYVIYYIANDRATATGNLSEQIKGRRVHTEDTTNPTVEMRFVNPDGTEVTESPQSDASIRLIFSEGVKGGTTKGTDVFLNLYKSVQDAYEELLQSGNEEGGDSDEALEYSNARKELADALARYITMYKGTPDGSHTKVNTRTENPNDWTIDWYNAQVKTLEDGSGRVEIFLPTVMKPTVTTGPAEPDDDSALNMSSGTAYYFHLAGIYDLAVIPNDLDPSPCDLTFTTRFAKVQLTAGDELINEDAAGTNPNNDPQRIDYHFIAEGQGIENMNDDKMRWDMLIWADTAMWVTLYERKVGDTTWTRMGQLDIPVDENEGYAYRSVGRWIEDMTNPNPTPNYGVLQDFVDKEYAVHIDKLDGIEDATSWNQTATIRVSIVAGTQGALANVITGATPAEYEKALGMGVLSVGTPDPFTMSKLFTDSKAPGFDRPSINVHDTGAKITVMPNRPGQVYWMVIPLSNLRQGSALVGSKELTEAEVLKVTAYDPALEVLKQADGTRPGLSEVPLMSGDPDLEATTAPAVDKLVVSQPIREYFTNDRKFPDVLKGSTERVPAFSQANIDLTGELTDNTVYLLCLMTRGVSSVYSDEIYCYRFTTNMPERPTLTLGNRSNAVVDATVDRTTQVQAALLINNASLDNTILNKPFLTYARTDNGYSSLGKDADYTVLEALRDNDGDNMVNNQYPSIFDTYATEPAKQAVMGLISASSDDTIVKAFYPATDVVVRPNDKSNYKTMEFSRDKLRNDVRYICLAMAGTGGVESRAFRALYPVTLLNDEAPEIKNVAAGFDFNDDRTKITSGTITINFTRALYRYGTLKPDKAYPVQHKNGPTTDTATTTELGMAAFISVLTTDLTIPDLDMSPMSYVTIKVGETSSSVFSVNIAPDTFCGEGGGTEFMEGGTVKVTVDKASGDYTVTFNNKPI